MCQCCWLPCSCRQSSAAEHWRRPARPPPAAAGCRPTLRNLPLCPPRRGAQVIRNSCHHGGDYEEAPEGD